MSGMARRPPISRRPPSPRALRRHWRVRPPAAVALRRPASALIIGVFPILRVVVVLGFEQVGGVQVRALLESDVDERCLDAAEHGVYPPEVDVADGTPLVRAID